MSAIQIYDTLSDFYHSLGIPLAQETEFTVHTTAKLHEYYPEKSPLFRANYYSIVLIRAGRGRYICDSQTFETRPYTLYFTNPGHIKGFEISEPYYGYIITFSEKFLKQHLHEAIFEEFPFLLAETAAPEYLTPTDFAPFETLCAQLLAEYHGHSPYKYKLLSSWLRIFLLKLKEMFWQAYDPRDSRASPIVTAFKHNLEAHFRQLVARQTEHLFQVQDFAQWQGLHPNYLSTVIKSKTGKTVNRWIADKLVAEAQALLVQSSQPIKAIAHQLAFAEPTHFSKFFKKQTGMTPSAFRRAQRTP